MEAAELIVPEGGGQVTREQLWNLAEAAEKRKDARVAREWELTFPKELGGDEHLETRKAMACEFARAIAERYGCAVDADLHKPNKLRDPETRKVMKDEEGRDLTNDNWHAHLLQTTRKLVNGKLTEKTDAELADKDLEARAMKDVRATTDRELSDPEAKKLANGKWEPGRKQIWDWRERWDEICNRELERANSATRVDHRSLKQRRDVALIEARELKAQGREHEAKLKELDAAELDRDPQQHVGWKASAMERRGVETRRGEDRRAAQRQAKERHSVVTEMKRKVTQLWERGKAAIREVIQPQPKPLTPYQLECKRLNELAEQLVKQRIVTNAAESDVRLVCKLFDDKGQGRGKHYLENLCARMQPGEKRSGNIRGLVGIDVTMNANGEKTFELIGFAGKERQLADELRTAAARPEPRQKQKQQQEKENQRVNVKQRGGRGD